MIRQPTLPPAFRRKPRAVEACTSPSAYYSTLFIFILQAFRSFSAQNIFCPSRVLLYAPDNSVASDLLFSSGNVKIPKRRLSAQRRRRDSLKFDFTNFCEGAIIQADLLACKGKSAPYFNATACFREKTRAARAARQRLAFDAVQCYNTSGFACSQGLFRTVSQRDRVFSRENTGGESRKAKACL